MRGAVGRRGSEGQVDRMNAYDSPETSALAHTIKRTNVNYPRTPAVDGWAPQRKPAVKSNMIGRVCLEGETNNNNKKNKANVTVSLTVCHDRRVLPINAFSRHAKNN